MNLQYNYKGQKINIKQNANLTHDLKILHEDGTLEMHCGLPSHRDCIKMVFDRIKEQANV